MVTIIFSPPNFSLEWAIAMVMRRRRRRHRRRQHFRNSPSSNARVLKFCTDFLDGSEGGELHQVGTLSRPQPPIFKILENLKFCCNQLKILSVILKTVVENKIGFQI